MKKMVLAFVLITMGLFVYAQTNLPSYYPASGRWSIIGGRLYQNDENARLAKVNIPIPQNSPVIAYEFDARYEGGAEDGHGGFGLHIFADSSFNRESWGAGQSYLLWLNYDEKPLDRRIQPGLSAQIYRSVSNTQMELIDSFDLNGYADFLTSENLSAPVHFKIVVDSNNGEVHVYDPVDDNYYYVFNLDGRYLPLKGNWVVLRTNGMKMSFAME
jgi:hypothetical protein